MNIIFDLDGTLIDSAPGILSTLMYVISEHEIDCIDKLKPEIIGPPLRELLDELTGRQVEEKILDLMAKTFISHYDAKGVFETTIYAGIPEMLITLKNQKHKLYIATNKRMAPTHALTKFFSWNDYFEGIYALDFFKPALKNKASLLQQIVKTHGLILADTIYIGDRPEDHEAAIQVNIKFLRASWGYGINKDGDDYSTGILITPSEIFNYVN